MASIVASPAPAQQDPSAVAPFTAQEIEHNKNVEALERKVMTISADILTDMKPRQLPDGVKGDKVYGKTAANRSVLNAYAGEIKKVANTIIPKLRKGGSKKPKGKFIGFAVPAYILPVMAVELGLAEGKSPLWEQGGKPIFSTALITRFFYHRAMLKGLVYPDKLSLFRCDDVMKRLFTPFLQFSHKEGKPPIDLDRLDYMGLQQLSANFAEKRPKGTPGLLKTDVGTPEQRERAARLIEIFTAMETKFKKLGKLKDKVKESMENEDKAKQSVVLAKLHLDAGDITQELFNDYVTAYQQAENTRQTIFEQYRRETANSGISF